MSGQMPPDRCTRCGRFVGFYPVGFYVDELCARCYDETCEDGPPMHFMRALFEQPRPAHHTV